MVRVIMVRGRFLFFFHALILFAILSGIYFRFENLEKKLFWHDEIGTRLFSAGLPIEEWNRVIYTGEVLNSDVVRTIHRLHPKGAWDVLKGLATDDPHHPPLYYVLVGVWVRVFGDEIATLRMLSAFFSLLLLPAVYWLSREIFPSKRIAWIATALIALSPFFVLYAQEAREYSLWFVWIALSNAALLRAIRLTESRLDFSSRIFWAWALCTLFTCLGLYTSLATATVIASQAGFILFRERFRITKITILSASSLSLGVILFAPWAIALAMRWEAFQISMAWSKMIHIPNRNLLAILALNISRPIIDFWPDYNGLVSVVSVGMATILVVGAILFFLFRAPLKTGALLLFLIFVPVLIVLVPDLLFGGIRSVSARYLSPALIGMILVLAYFYGSGNNTGIHRFRNTALYVAFSFSFASCIFNAKQEVVWPKGISYNLPRVAHIINQSSSPLVVGNRERHHPGNLLALSYLLKTGTKMQFLSKEGGYFLPPAFTNIFLYSPTDEFRHELEKKENVETRLMIEDLHLQLWVVEKKIESPKY